MLIILLHTVATHGDASVKLTVKEYFRGLSHCSQDSQTGIESKLIKNPPNTYKKMKSINMQVMKL